MANAGERTLLAGVARSWRGPYHPSPLHASLMPSGLTAIVRDGMFLDDPSYEQGWQDGYAKGYLAGRLSVKENPGATDTTADAEIAERFGVPVGARVKLIQDLRGQVVAALPYEDPPKDSKLSLDGSA